MQSSGPAAEPHPCPDKTVVNPGLASCENAAWAMAYHQITPGIWLGSIMALQGQKSLRDAGATHVLSVLDIQAMGTSVENFKSLPIFKEFEHLYISVEDVDEEDLLQHFDTTFEYIDKAISGGGGVLVHCIAGISRSATVVCAYLMRKHKWTPEQALAFVRKGRPIAHPNDGFMEQLQVYYLSGFAISTEAKAYREWRLQQQARELSFQRVRTTDMAYTQVDMPPLSVRWSHVIPALLKRQPRPGLEAKDVAQVDVGEQSFGVTEPIADSVRLARGDVRIQLVSVAGTPFPIEAAVLRDVFHQAATRLVSFRCKACSAKLASGGSVVRHEPGKDGACQHWFLEPVEWMRPELEKGELEGKLGCPRCDKKVGAYLWQGSKCSCGVWVTPSIKLSKAKVDEMATTARPLL